MYLRTMKPKSGADYIYALIAEGEHVNQDFKYEISDARKIARTLSAFSNTEGGRLLIGVKDNGRIAGVRSEEEMYMIDAAARLYCKPEVAVEMSTYVVEGKTVLLADVSPADAKPVMAVDDEGRQWAYVRIADENILATPTHLGVWRQAKDMIPSVLTYTEQERRLLELLASENGCTLNRLCRHTSLARRQVVSLLARFIHWGISEAYYENGRFLYRAV